MTADTRSRPGRPRPGTLSAPAASRAHRVLEDVEAAERSHQQRELSQLAERLHRAYAHHWGRETSKVPVRLRDAVEWAIRVASADLGIPRASVRFFTKASPEDVLSADVGEGFIGHSSPFSGLAVPHERSVWIAVDLTPAQGASIAFHEVRHRWQFERAPRWPESALETDAAAYAACFAALIDQRVDSGSPLGPLEAEPDDGAASGATTHTEAGDRAPKMEDPNGDEDHTGSGDPGDPGDTRP